MPLPDPTVDLPPTTRTDDTVEVGNHATDHNKLAAALAQVIDYLQNLEAVDQAGQLAQLADDVNANADAIAQLTANLGGTGAFAYVAVGNVARPIAGTGVVLWIHSSQPAAMADGDILLNLTPLTP